MLCKTAKVILIKERYSDSPWSFTGLEAIVRWDDLVKFWINTVYVNYTQVSLLGKVEILLLLEYFWITEFFTELHKIVVRIFCK